MPKLSSAKKNRMVILALALITVFFMNGTSSAQAFGQISGRVVDKDSRTPLPGANLLLAGTNRGAVSDLDGRFTIMRVAPGAYTLKVTFIGYKEASQNITVVEKKSVTANFSLAASILKGEEIEVIGELTRGQAKALQQQRTAQNIVQVVSEEFFGRFPDRNAAETVRRLPSISVSRDQGEGEMVQIRGMDQNYNSLTLNGIRIPSPDPDGGQRSVGLDLVNNRLLGEIEVIKAITPDMDGDAIGGVVNFGLRRAPAEGTAVIGVGGGYNNQISDFTKYGRDIQDYYALLGKRFFGNKLGVLLDAAYYRTVRHSKLRQLDYLNADGVYDETIGSQHTNDYDVNRQRYGVSFGTDYQFNPSHRIYLTINHNTYLDDEIRREAEWVIAGKNETRETRNRREDQRLNLGMFGGDHNLGIIQFNYKAAWIKSSEEMPGRTYLRYQRKLSFDNFTNDEIKEFDGTTEFVGADPPKLNRIRYDLNLKEDEDRSGQVNFKVPFSLLSGGLSHFKFGSKILNKKIDYNFHRYQQTKFAQAYTLEEGTFGFVDVRYDDPKLKDILTNPTESVASSYDSYDASETITSFYGMLELSITQKLSSVLGLRFEDTQTDYKQPYPNSAAITGRSILEGSGGYNNLLPSLHVMYRFNDRNNLKLAYSTGLARPQYTNLVPRMVISEPPNSNDAISDISYGNPDLEPRTAYNFDLMFDRFTADLGVLSFGVFYKNFKAWHATATWFEEHDFVNASGDLEPDGINETYRAKKPVMGSGTAKYYGFEVNVQQRLHAIASWLKWFAVNANYTYSKSEGEVEGRKVTMTRCPTNIANLSLIYDNAKLGLSAVMAANYRDPFLTGVGENKYMDVYFDRELFFDFSIVQKITGKLLLIAQLNGLGITDEHETRGKPGTDYERTQQWEKYGVSGTIGLQYTIR